MLINACARCLCILYNWRQLLCCKDVLTKLFVMLQSWITGNGLLFCLLAQPVLSQSITSTIDELCANLDCSLATYILIGIAALYAVLSVMCVVLICVACKCCKKRTKTKVQPQSPSYEELDDVFYSNSNHQLEAIVEEVATEDFFVNKNASTEDFPESEDSTTDDEAEGKPSSSSTSEPDESDKETSLVIKNSSAKKKVLSPKKKVDSTIHNHQPKSSPIPPKKVPVPFSEPSTSRKEKKPLEDSPISPSRAPVRLPPLQIVEGTPRQRKNAAAGAIIHHRGESEVKSSSSSPFPSQKSKDSQSAGKGTPKVNKVTRVENLSGDSIGTPIDESTLKFEMVKLSHKWQKVGRAFNLPASFLSNLSVIKDNNNDACMLQVCEEWLKQGKERDWRELVEILRSEEIAEHRLADYLRIYYYKPESGMLQFDEDMAKKSSESNLSFYFKQQPSSKETETVENEDESEETSWIN